MIPNKEGIVVEILHAPWRIEYIMNKPQNEGDGSIFTQIGRSNEDGKNLVLYRGKSCFTMLNNYPYAGGHSMVIPYREVRDLDELSREENLELWGQVSLCRKAMSQEMHPHGFNIGINLGEAAGAGIAEHLHVHVVPRWRGDFNFMPVIGQTNILPEALLQVAEKLRNAMKNLAELSED